MPVRVLGRRGWRVIPGMRSVRRSIGNRPPPPISADELRECLSDPRAPFGMMAGKAGMLITLPDLHRFVAKREFDYPGLEDDLDRLMVELGAKSMSYWDPWSAPLRFLQRRLGHRTPKMVNYEVPDALVPRKRSRYLHPWTGGGFWGDGGGDGGGGC